jgi:hypothetical protein
VIIKLSNLPGVLLQVTAGTSNWENAINSISQLYHHQQQHQCHYYCYRNYHY